MSDRGRPTEYTEERASEIVRRLASGESLRRICSDDAMPAASTVIGWVVEDREGFSERYARARQIQAEILADEIFDIADDGSNDYTVGEKGIMLDAEHIQRSRLRVDTRKWYLSKVLPKFADKTRVESSDYQFNPADFSRDGLKRVAAGESPQHVLATGGGRDD